MIAVFVTLLGLGAVFCLEKIASFALEVDLFGKCCSCWVLTV